MASELGVLGIAGKLSMPSIILCKKFKKKLIFFAEGLSKIQSTTIWLIGILGIKAFEVLINYMFKNKPIG